MLLAAPMIFLAVTLYLFTLPRLFAGTAVVNVVFPEPAGQRYDASALDRLMRTQVELMKSAPVLDAAIRNLDLPARWGRQFSGAGSTLAVQQCRQLLENGLSIDARPGTAGPISVRVLRQDPKEAAEIANAITAAYRELLAVSVQQGEPREVQVVEPAETDLRPASPNLIQGLTIAAVLALLLVLAGVGLILTGVRSRR